LKILLLDLGKQMRGGQRQVLYLARHLQKNDDFDPLIVVPETSPLLEHAREWGISCKTIISASDLNPINILNFFKLIRKYGPDVIHTNDAKGASLAALAKTAARRDFKLVHSRRVSYSPKKGWSTKKYLMGDMVVGVSQEICRTMIKCGVRKEYTKAIHSGIDTTLYSSSKNRGSLFTIGSIGALTKQKGTHVLLEALKLLKNCKDLPEWQCLIAGNGPLMKDLQEHAQKYGISNSILFLGHAESTTVLEKIDVLAVPSVDGEGSNAVIKEGWATGTPLVASDLPSNLELVTEGKDGLVFPNKDAAALADAISKLMTDKKLAQQLVQEGYSSVQRFSVEMMGDKYVELYKSLLRQ